MRHLIIFLGESQTYHENWLNVKMLEVLQSIPPPALQRPSRLTKQGSLHQLQSKLKCCEWIEGTYSHLKHVHQELYQQVKKS
jgi:hypothetical protein